MLPRIIAIEDSQPMQPSATGGGTSAANIIKSRRRTNKSEPSFSMLVLIFAGLLMTILSRSSIILSNSTISSLISHKEDAHKKFFQVEESMLNLLDFISLIDDKDAIAATVKYEEDKTVILQQRQQIRERKNHLEEVNILKQKITILNNRADSFKEHIQTISKRDAIKKYGSSVQIVEIELAFPVEKKYDSSNTFVIELAPIDIMPHSVYTFLEMVSAKLLDGCSFVLNDFSTVLKTAPIPYEEGSSFIAIKQKKDQFKDHGLEKGVAFREYNHDYPHRKYTIGFAADDSPSFYINTNDNTEIHLGDPCFGEIVKGFEAISILQNFPTKNGIWFEQKIGIKRARIITI